MLKNNLLVYYFVNLIYEAKRDLKRIKNYENIKTLYKE